MTALLEGLTQGTWTLDPAHTAVSFSIRHAGISRARGTFEDVQGQLVVGESYEDLRFSADIQMASVDTGNEDRDNHLRNADFFDADQFPQITFEGTSFRPKSDDTFELTGQLTMHGETKEITLDVEFGGIRQDGYGQTKAGFSFKGKLNRADFGLTWNALLEAGGVAVSEEVKLDGEVQFVKSAA